MTRTLITRNEAAKTFILYPAEIGRWCGFEDLTKLHNDWLKEMIYGKNDYTLQAHRLSYKTTCISIAIAIFMIMEPDKTIMFFRKTDTDVQEVLRQITKILQNVRVRELAKIIWGIDLFVVNSTQNFINTSYFSTPRGASQLSGMGISTSITGKHADLIITDDIVNLSDRVSLAEREKTKRSYYELQNIRNHGGKILNCGTPWHKNDCFVLMPNIHKFDCYSTGIMSQELIEEKKNGMTASLFAANYELKHIADEDVIFSNVQYSNSVEDCYNGVSHVDAAYGGSDYTAFTIMNKKGNNYYVYAKLWNKHVDECLDEIVQLHNDFMCEKLYCEKNADKGYLAKVIRERGLRVINYSESMNKFIKITSYLKAAWNNVYFVPGTDLEYINQVLDYNENAEHDDAPDSLASIIREKYFSKEDKKYESPFA